MNTLPPEERAILDAARDADDPTHEDRARIDAAMQRALAAHGIPLLSGAPTPSQAPFAGSAQPPFAGSAQPPFAGSGPALGASGPSSLSPAASGAAAAAAGTALKAKLMGALLVAALGTAGVMGGYVAFEATPDAPSASASSLSGGVQGATSKPALDARAAVPGDEPGQRAPHAVPAEGPGDTLEAAPGAGHTQGDSVEAAWARQGAARSLGPSSPRPPASRRQRWQAVRRADTARGTGELGQRQDPPPIEANAAAVAEAPAAAQHATGDEPTSPKAQLREEMRLLARARGELAGGAAQRALETLQLHARQFEEGGRLWQERLGLQVLALCEAGRVAEGRRVRATLLERAPNAIMAERVRRACTTPGQSGQER